MMQRKHWANVLMAAIVVASGVSHAQAPGSTPEQPKGSLEARALAAMIEDLGVLETALKQAKDNIKAEYLKELTYDTESFREESRELVKESLTKLAQEYSNDLIDELIAQAQAAPGDKHLRASSLADLYEEKVKEGFAIIASAISDEQAYMDLLRQQLEAFTLALMQIGGVKKAAAAMQKAEATGKRNMDLLELVALVNSEDFQKRINAISTNINAIQAAIEARKAARVAAREAETEQWLQLLRIILGLDKGEE